MCNLIISCDGTWNHPDQKDDGMSAPTNVRKLHNLLIKNPQEGQLAHYQPGVGTEGFIDKAIGGTVGAGISEDICECYQWLASHYQQGDLIWIFGFSRGAFAARSLAGMIGKCGLLDLTAPDAKGHNKMVKNLYDKIYRIEDARPASLPFDYTFHEPAEDGEIPIHFLGVWDTVGALGIPDDKGLLDIFDNPKKYRFHNVTLGSNIKCARHALAMDEMRGSFSPTRWENTTGTHCDAVEKWFPGVHCDVGGGYAEHGLSDGALLWMIDEAKQKGLGFHELAVDNITPDPLDALHDSRKGVMKALIPVPRTLPDINNDRGEFHESVHERRHNPSALHGEYRPTVNLDLGQEFTLDISSKTRWNWTGLYYQSGQQYELSAKGEWMDSSIPSSPDGTADGDFHLGEIVHVFGSFLGGVETILQKILRKDQLDLIATKRFEDADWFALIGTIGDAGPPGRDGTVDVPPCFTIGTHHILKMNRNGYLYCFANDAWGFYHNNRGSVQLTIKRTA